VSDNDGDSARLNLPKDLAALADLVVNHNVAVLSLDPLLTHVDSGLDSHKDHEIRRALEPLKRFAEETGCTVLGNAHHNKGLSADPVMRITGSAAIGQVVRAVLAFACDDEADCFVISQAKNNHGRLDLPSLAYAIESVVIDTAEGPTDVGRIVFRGHATRSVGDIMANQAADHAPARGEAEEFLREVLANGPRSSQEIQMEAKAAGISATALRKARTRICRVFKAGMQDGWYWELLAEDDPSPVEGDPSEDTVTFDSFEAAPQESPSNEMPCSCGQSESWETADHLRVCAVCYPLAHN